VTDPSAPTTSVSTASTTPVSPPVYSIEATSWMKTFPWACRIGVCRSDRKAKAPLAVPEWFADAGTAVAQALA
jgi:hypothetical protein